MKTVLVLDDDPTILAILGRTFQSLGAEVVTCREIEAAEAVLDVLPVDAVLTDLCVSGLGGLEGTRLLRRVASERPQVRTFAMSAHLDGRARAVVEALGVVDAFQKPFDPRGTALRVLGEEGRGPGRLRAIEPLAAFLGSGKLRALLQPVVALKPASAPFPIHGIEGFASAPEDCPLRNPALLFGLAARKDRLAQTDLLCAREVLREAGRLGRGSRLFLNVHPGSLRGADFAKGLVEEVALAGLSPSDVVLELSERQALDLAALTATLAPLRKAGFRISLDNYGEGTSNLRLLVALRPDYVKLAGSFTEGIDVDPVQREVVRSTRDLLSRLGIRTILSRIETPTELATALELGLEYGQGWHFSRPMSADELRGAGAFSGPANDTEFRRRSNPFSVPA
jgi:EAL domain-containing protein (putative c-di-GMP-specific phosphodiesterase class I)